MQVKIVAHDSYDGEHAYRFSHVARFTQEGSAPRYPTLVFTEKGLTGVAARAKGLPRPVGRRSGVAARAQGLSGLVCELANAAIGARVGHVPPLARSLLAWAALDALPEVVDPRNATVAACWARSALRRVADFKVGGKLAGIAR